MRTLWRLFVLAFWLISLLAALQVFVADHRDCLDRIPPTALCRIENPAH